jgi:hypothetical protein
MLAAAMLVAGAAIGAAIGPAPSTSFAGASRIPLLLGSLSSPSSPGGPGVTAAAPVVPAVTPAPTRRKRAAAASPPAPAPGAAAPEAPASPEPQSPAPTPLSTGGGKASKLAPATNVWLIELSGSTFEAALTQPTVAPYIDGPGVKSGALLSGWSALEGSAFASATALLAGSPPQLLDSIVQPPCAEGPTGAPCAPGTPGALSAADAFLKQTVETITGTAAYRAHGLIVVTFASIASATATGLPTGSSSATVSSQPPAGVLLISPFAKAGPRQTAAFSPTSPRQSIEKLLHR